jgi:hypothetical protein
MFVSLRHTGFASEAAAFCAAMLFVAAFLGVGPAFALTEEQARQHCRETVGHPIVQNCLGARRKGGVSDAEREACTTMSPRQALRGVIWRGSITRVGTRVRSSVE